MVHNAPGLIADQDREKKAEPDTILPMEARQVTSFVG
jgi:hypothetical protein